MSNDEHVDRSPGWIYFLSFQIFPVFPPCCVMNCSCSATSNIKRHFYEVKTATIGLLRCPAKVELVKNVSYNQRFFFHASNIFQRAVTLPLPFINNF